MSDEEEGVLLADGFGKALIGIGTQFNTEVAIYDYEKCVQLLMKRDSLSREEAEEHMEFNVTGGYVGPHTPVFLRCRSLKQWYDQNDADYEPHP
jgi:hypothetical protein